jgi:hypothetical protein
MLCVDASSYCEVRCLGINNRRVYATISLMSFGCISVVQLLTDITLGRRIGVVVPTIPHNKRQLQPVHRNVMCHLIIYCY